VIEQRACGLEVAHQCGDVQRRGTVGAEGVVGAVLEEEHDHARV
jgi:hypothetical protein